MHDLLKVKNMFTPKEVAIIFDVNPEAVRSWCRSGLFLRAFKIGRGRDWRIPKNDILEMMKPEADREGW